MSLIFNRPVFFIAIFFLSFSGIRADEGMWIPALLSQLNEADMQAKGLKLTAEDIYSINKSSLKDAVVHFGGGCTAEMVSPEGLMFTNHHCGYSSIQSHSSVENDYLTNGFWAMSRGDELKNPGLTATFIVRIEDVTKGVMEGISGETSEEERQRLISENAKKIKEEATKETHYEALIKPFYYGNEYYMIVTETFKDVRLVGAPPSSIGKFGGDTDNWMWPRHTGDFAVFRIYADKDNKPADYSEDNVPYQPGHFFPISINGVKEGDFTMVYGFPGSTNEYLTSYAVDYIMNKSNPARIRMREKSLSILDIDMKASDETRIKYASKYARISNYYKKWIGENRGLKRLDALTVKRELEQEFNRLAGSTEAYKTQYGSLLADFEKQYRELERYAFARDYFIELVYYGPEIIRHAGNFRKLVESAEAGELTAEEKDKQVESLKKSTDRFFKNYNQPTDRKLFSAMMKLYDENTDQALQAGIFQTIRSKYKGDFEKYADYVYTKSQLTDQESANAFLDNLTASSAKKLAKDPAYILMKSIFDNYSDMIRPTYVDISNEIDRLSGIYIRGQMEIMPDHRKYYPDANGTLRVAYGKVEGYEPKDGVRYDYFSTLSGVIEKADPASDEFRIFPKLETLYANKDFGPYGKDDVVVCFTASNHTTGGNSGSPVLDAEGLLIGINFDRCWEGTMSDIMFDPDRCRNIAVDMRYVLFVIDKYAGAGYLLKEMEIISSGNGIDGPSQ